MGRTSEKKEIIARLMPTRAHWRLKTRAYAARLQVALRIQADLEISCAMLYPLLCQNGFALTRLPPGRRMEKRRKTRVARTLSMSGHPQETARPKAAACQVCLKREASMTIED